MASNLQGVPGAQIIMSLYIASVQNGWPQAAFTAEKHTLQQAFNQDFSAKMMSRPMTTKWEPNNT